MEVKQEEKKSPEKKKRRRRFKDTPIPKYVPERKRRMRKKVMVCRASGQPVQLFHLQQYKLDYQAAYDKVMAHVGFDPEKLHEGTEAMNERATKILTRIEKSLAKKYPNTEEWNEVRSRKVWHRLIAQYGPIAVAKTEDDELAYVILDVPFT